MDWTWLIWVVLAYLAGAVPFGLLIGLAKGVDVRAHGSGNVGATNVGRVLGRGWGFLCFSLDVLKGLLPVLLAGYALRYAGRWDLAAHEASQWLAVAVAAVLGHIFPVWLKFKGGKGVATGLGVLLGFWPLLTLPGLAALATWIVLALWKRYVSLASVAASIGLPVYLTLVLLAMDQLTLSAWPLLAVAFVLAGLVVVRHRGNLARIRAGTEPKIGSGK